MTQKLTNTMFTGTLTSSKLTGAMGSNDGSALTGLGGSGATISASDPTISTNPAGGVGTLWSNSTRGELFCCTDATAGENHWVNIGHGIGDVWQFGGTVAGFVAGGFETINVIDKFSFASNTTAADHGDLITGRYNPAASSSKTHGYAAGGRVNTPSVTHFTEIDKFSFASVAAATDHGDLTVARYGAASSSSATHGYTAGGTPGNTIDKFSFDSAGNATDHGDMVLSIRSVSGHTSATQGFTSGGHISPDVDNITKYSFASNVTATDLGNLSTVRSSTSGQSSVTHGFTSGGGPTVSLIETFAFASNANATTHANLSAGQYGTTGQSSTIHGYVSGGGPAPHTDTIERFTFASVNTVASHGDLSVGRQDSSGYQY